MQPKLFDVQKPRQPRRVLMHVIDAGPGCCSDGTTDTVRLGCAKCGHETEWQEMRVSDAKRGVPCPVCNE